MTDNRDTMGQADTPKESVNHRQTGARKLDARPGEHLHTSSLFDGNLSDKRDSIAHLMSPIVKGETHQYDGVNPPGSFGIEADPKADALESSPTEAEPENSRRPL